LLFFAFTIFTQQQALGFQCLALFLELPLHLTSFILPITIDFVQSILRILGFIFLTSPGSQATGEELAGAVRLSRPHRTGEELDFDPQGRELAGQRVTGYQDAAKFLQSLRDAGL